MQAIVNSILILEEGLLEQGFILFDEQIQAMGNMENWDSTLKAYQASEQSQSLSVYDAKGMYVSAGFIDVHIHGAGGCDTMDGHESSFETIGTTILKSGVTSYLATTMTMPMTRIENTLNGLKQYMLKQNQKKQAQILGVHLEGPFINRDKKGAQNGAYIIAPQMALIQDYLDIIKIITIAPETDVNFEFIEKMKAYPHIQLSIGHTNSDFDTAMKAFENGVTHITHCFNAMPPLHHREPGVLGAMMSEAFTTELIADNIHVHKGLYKGLCRCVGKDKLILITDSMRAGGLKEGEYDLGGQTVNLENGACRLADGTLAGSVLTMNQALKNFYDQTQLPLHEVINCATINPAKVLQVDSIKGSLFVGKDADLNIFNSTFEITKSYVRGK